MNKYKNMLFLAPDEGGGDGGGEAPVAGAGAGEITRGSEAFQPVPKITTVDRPLPEKKTGMPAPSAGPSGAGTEEPVGGEPDVKPTQAAPFDAEKFAREFGSTLSESLKPVLESRKEPQMTPEEARKLLNVWEPDDNWYALYDNLDTRKQAVLQMRDALVQQADTLNQARLEQSLQSLREEFMPHLEAATRLADEQRNTRFHTTYPALKEPALQPLIKAVANDLVERGKKFNTEEELFTELAKGVETVIKVNNPEFKLEAAGNGSSQNADRGGRQIPVTTPGGGGGPGRRENPGPKANRPKGLSIFDK